MEHEKLFWEADQESIRRGYIQQENQYICLICGKTFEHGFIYPYQEVFMDSQKAIQKHIENDHGSMFLHLMDMDKRYTGLTDHQKQLLTFFHQGLSDKEIAKLTGGNPTTLRTQRFALREKAKQAKVFLAIMESFEEKKVIDEKEQLIEMHMKATNIDDRYVITEQEKQTIIETYFEASEPKRLKSFPTKQKRKLVVLQVFAQRFDPQRTYHEKEVNDIIKVLFDDYVTIRRYLIEYGFLDRTKDGSQYWLNH